MRVLRPLILLLFCLPLKAQEKPVPLREVLGQIERIHNVRFNFIEEEIVVYRVTPPGQGLSLTEKIAYLQRETRLRFTKAGGNYYTIYNDKRMDKPLCGYLRDRETGRPVENAAILVAGRVVTSSNAEGYFELPVLTPETVSVRHQGFIPKEVNPEDLYVPQCPKILLEAIIAELPDVLAKPYIATGIGKTAEGTFTVRPPKFGILPGLAEPDVLQAMQQIPGIYSADETVSNLNVRGGTHDQNLFLWNGIRMFQTGHFFGLISGFNPSAVREVNIVKSGSAAHFGESVSSVVEISSRDAGHTGHYGFAINMISAEFIAQAPLSAGTSLMVSGRRSYTDWLQTATYRSYRDRVFQNTVVTEPGGASAEIPRTDEEFHFYDAAIQLQTTAGKHRITADAILMQNDLRLVQDFTRSNSLSQEHFGGNASVESNWSDRLSTTVAASASQYELESHHLSGEGQTLDQRNRVFYSDVRASGGLNINERASVESGYQVAQTAVTNFDQVNTPFFRRKITEVLVTHAAFTEFRQASASGKTSWRAGLRANYTPEFKMLLLEPRLFFRRQLAQALHLELSAERKSQTMSQVIDLQRDFLGIEKRRWVLANDADLPVQKSWQGTAGFSYSKNDWLATAEIFYKEIDGITSSEQGFQNQFEFIRASGAYAVYGVESLLQRRFGAFYSWISYAYTRNDYQFDPFAPRIFPNNFGFRHSISWAAIYERNRLKLAIGGKWNTGRPYTAARSEVPDFSIPGNPRVDYGRPNAETLPQYLQLNASASKEWALGKTKIQISAAVLNVLDRQNSIGRFYRVSPSGTAIETVETFGLGLTPNASLRVTF